MTRKIGSELVFSGLLVLAAGTGRAEAAWERLGGLVDVRYGGAADLAPEVLAGGASLDVPFPVTLDGRQGRRLTVGTGWIRLEVETSLSSLAPDGRILKASDTLPHPPRVDVLRGEGVRLAPDAPVLARVEKDAVAVRWTGLTLPSGEVASAEVLLDRLGAVTVQYLRLPSSARTMTCSPGSPEPASAYRLVEGRLPAPRPLPVPDANGPPPMGCDPTPQTWCDIADGPGDALIFIDETFDDGAAASRGWTTTGLWHGVDANTCAPGASGNPGRSTYFGQDATCAYLDNRTGLLSAPAVGPVTANTFLAFSLRLQKEDVTFPFPAPIDLAEVLVNGTVIASYLNPPDANAWYVAQPLPMSDPPNYDFAGQVVTISFRFTSDSSVVDLGWFVDDVALVDGNGTQRECVQNAGSLGYTACDARALTQWNFNESQFCLNCPYTFYVLVECGREMHLPMWDMEGADIRISNVLTGAPVPLRCRNQTSLADAGLGPYPTVISGECCAANPGVEAWWGPAMDQTDSAGPGHVEWGFPDCPNIDRYDRNGDGGISCNELPGCGGPLPEITPGESQITDCHIVDESGLCGIYRLDVGSGGFVWSLFANCDGTNTPQFPIFLDCTEAWQAFNPLPELAVANPLATPGCPDVALTFDVQNIGCADYTGDVPIRVRSNCVPQDVRDYVVPGPVPAGESVTFSIDFTTTCAPVDLEIVVDPDDVVLECTESPTAAACRAAPGIDSVIVSTCTCAPSVTSPVADATICVGDAAVLDATGIGFANCLVPVDYDWFVGGAPAGTGGMISVSPGSTTTYEVVATCPANPDCVARDTATVTVHQFPVFPSAAARDYADCNLAVELTWPAAVFGSGAGVYNVFRSDVSCADALLRPPVALGLLGTSWLDTNTAPEGTYYYVIEAEDALVPTPCVPTGASFGGAATRACAGPVTDSYVPSFPEGVYAVLRARHDGDVVTMMWPRVRALLSGEHFHLRKSPLAANGTFGRINPESDLSLEYTETDTSAWLQFFDLRAANRCEQESLTEYPPGR
jgi:hypothetical protein